MNRYSLIIKIGKRIKDVYKFTVVADNTKEYVKQVIQDSQKQFKYESAVDLMDYVCDTYGWKWEDFTPDIEIEIITDKIRI